MLALFFQCSCYLTIAGLRADSTGLPAVALDIDRLFFGRFMTNRAGFAWHNEYSWIRYRGLAPDGSDLTSSSLMLGFDFAF
jgi:hypothetical protein